MEKNKKNRTPRQDDGIMDKRYENRGTKITGQDSGRDVNFDPVDPRLLTKRKEKASDGNIGKNNAGGYK